jgi:hypothetical protein
MVKLLARVSPVLACFSTFAQTASTEVVIEPASNLTVEIFVALFIASCVGFVWYMWWSSKKKGHSDSEE